MNVCGASRAEESVEGVLQRQAVVVAREEHTGARVCVFAGKKPAVFSLLVRTWPGLQDTH